MGNNMKKTFHLLPLLWMVTSSSFSTTHTITNSGFTFSPNSITINLGDTVKFVLESMHNAREVSEATWNAGGNTSNGGFDLPFGGGTVVLTQTGIHYYVCVPHASIGMKGTITVNSGTEVFSAHGTIPDQWILMQNYPNPFNPSTMISFILSSNAYVSLKIFDAVGREVSTIAAGEFSAGKYVRPWNAAGYPSGVYFYRLSAVPAAPREPLTAKAPEAQAGQYTITKKLVLLR